MHIHWKDWCWSWSSNTVAIWCKELTHWKRPWCWERLKAGEEGDNRRWDGWMASMTRWTWVWASSWSWWCTRESCMLQFMESHRFGHDWATEEQQQKCWSRYPSPWTEGPGGLQSMGSQRLRDKRSNWHFTLHLKILDLGFQEKLFVLYIFCLRWSYCIAQGIIFNTL